MSVRKERKSDLLALLGLASMGAWVFRVHLVGGGTFIGDSDRLNTFLNILTYEIESLHHGSLEAWNDSMFMGFNIYSLPYTFPNPLTYLAALFPVKDLFWIAGVISCGLLILAGWAAYLFIKDTCGHPFSAFVGAALYEFSTLSTLKVSQNDMSFAVLIHLPLVLLSLRRVRPGNSAACFVGLTFILVSLLYFTFLQKVAYALLLAGAYAVYRSFWLRSWRPSLVFVLSLGVAVTVTFPRLYTVGQEFGLLRRAAVGYEVQSFDGLYEFQNIRPRELLRWFNDGIFGRFPGEAATLGNNINLHEGLLLYTSTFAAFLVLLGLVRFWGGWLRLTRFKDEDAPFHLWFLILVFTVVLVKPVLYVFYLLFLKVDFTHTRIVVAGLLPVCTLVAVLVHEALGTVANQHWNLAGVYLFLVSAAGALGILWSVDSLAQRVREPMKLLLNEPLPYMSWVSLRLLISGTAAQIPSAPSDLTATAHGPTEIILRWKDVAGETNYRVEMKGHFRSSFTQVGTTGPNVTDHIIGGLAPNENYFFRIRACNEGSCSPYSSEALATTLQNSATATDVVLSRVENRFTWIFSTELMKIEWAAIAFALVMVGMWVCKDRPGPRLFLGHCLGFIMVFQAFAYADFQINGVHTRAPAVPFESNNFLMAKAGEFRLPGKRALLAFSERLKADQYRSVLVCDPKQFPAFCAPHLSQFWQLRVVEGYSFGVPQRLASLPWPDGVLSLRAISFPSIEALPWPLLSFLNVKYAVVVNPGFYKNTGVNSTGLRSDVLPEDVEICENPFPVVPRHFFAETVVPVTDLAEAVRTLFPSNSPSALTYDVTKQSVVEKFPVPQRFTVNGKIQARYRGDKIEIDVDATDAPRFLVLNELYHPGWRAYAGSTELKVYPTNTVMRGLVVPPGVSHLTLGFVPFFRTETFLFFLGAGTVLLLGGCWGFWQMETESPGASGV